MNASKWNPTAAPFRATWIVNTNSPGLHGWAAHVVGCYATEAEALEALFANRPKYVRYGVIDFAKNAATWCKNGSWKQVGSKFYPPTLHNGHVIAYKRALRAAAQ